jgi:hypothetical protein
MKSDEELLADLSRATRGLFVMSESDYPFETIYLKDETEPGPQRLRQLAGAGEDAIIETRSPDEFFNSTTFETVSKEGGAFNAARGYEALAELLRNNLTELRVYRIGRINISVIILGKSPTGNWLGLSTRVVET